MKSAVGIYTFILKKIWGVSMAKYQCTVCGYVYNEDEGDPESNVPPGTKWKDLPEDWVCPICGATKDQFEKID